MVSFERVYNSATMEYTVTVRYTLHDELRADLLPADRAILRSCAESSAASDQVLALELLVRRMEEGRARLEANQ